jgi:hypothetical protein
MLSLDYPPRRRGSAQGKSKGQKSLAEEPKSATILLYLWLRLTLGKQQVVDLIAN